MSIKYRLQVIKQRIYTHFVIKYLEGVEDIEFLSKDSLGILVSLKSELKNDQTQLNAIMRVLPKWQKLLNKPMIVIFDDITLKDITKEELEEAGFPIGKIEISNNKDE